MSNKELINLYLSSLAELSPETIKLRKYILEEFLKAISGKSMLEIETLDIRNYIIKKKEANEWKKASTIAGNLMVLKLFYHFLTNENYVKENPAKNVKSPRHAFDTEIRPFNSEEIKRLVKVATDSNWVSLRDKLIFFIAITSSLRASEISSIKKANIDLTKKLIYMPKDDVKGKYRAKLVPISEKTKQLIELYLIKYPSQSEYLFNTKGNRVSRLLIHRAMKLIIDIAYPYKNSWNKPYGTHIARHTFATRWIESGGDVHALKAIMGWKSFVQLDRYVNVSPQFIQKAALKIEKKLLDV